MDIKRVKEIIDSPEVIYVTYQNLPVWIDAVNSVGRVAIRDLNSDVKMEVSSEELLETGKLQD